MEKCGQCNQEFEDTDAYLAHDCPTTGFKPTEPEHQGPEFLHVQKAALERGMERLPDDTADVMVQQAAIDEVQEKIDNAPAPATDVAIEQEDSYKTS